ncbi:MAG: hypothetical protein OXR07_06095, partial [Nitrospira sp.]|nr:hypothetical protein [Nitrospira sp.]
RPLDFYWPLLAVAAAEGLQVIGTFMATWVKRQYGKHRKEGGRSVRKSRNRPKREEGSQSVAMAGGMWAVRAWVLMLFAPVLLYAGAIQGAMLYEGSKVVEYRSQMHSELNEGNVGRWLVAPGMSKLVAISNTLHQESTLHLAPSPWMEHRAFARWRLQQWKPYEHMARGMIPDDAVGQEGMLGIMSYYLPDLTIIDVGGLADATVARNPPTGAGRRMLAHERQPPPGYLEQRGVNFYVRPAARTTAEAFRQAHYAIEVGPGLWMPFDSNDHQWVAERFASLNLKSRSQ